MGKNNQRFSYDYVKLKFEEHNYTLLSTEYKNVKSFLIVRCDKGHIYHPPFERFMNGHRCPYCNGNGRITIDDIKNFLNGIGYTLLDGKIQNSKSMIKIQCNKGHKYSTSWNYLRSGLKCPRCFGGSRLPYALVKEKIESVKGYKLISETYVMANRRLEIECDKGHRYKAPYCNFYKGSRCPKCSNSKMFSKGEKEVCEFVRSIYHGVVLENDRLTILNPKTNRFLELDIYLPEIGFAIEYGCEFYHGKEKAIKREKFKLEECNRMNIQLYIVQEEEWLINKQKFFDEIKDIINRKLLYES